MRLFLEDAEGNAQEIAHVTREEVAWDSDGLKLIGCANAKATNFKVLADKAISLNTILFSVKPSCRQP